MTKTIAVLLSLCIMFGCSKPPEKVLVDRVVKESAQGVDDHIKELQACQGDLVTSTEQLSDCQKKCAECKTSKNECPTCPPDKPCECEKCQICQICSEFKNCSELQTDYEKLRTEHEELKKNYDNKPYWTWGKIATAGTVIIFAGVVIGVVIGGIVYWVVGDKYREAKETNKTLGTQLSKTEMLTKLYDRECIKLKNSINKDTNEFVPEDSPNFPYPFPLYSIHPYAIPVEGSDIPQLKVNYYFKTQNNRVGIASSNVDPDPNWEKLAEVNF